MFLNTLIFIIAIGLQIVMMLYVLYFTKESGYSFLFWAGAIALSLLLPQGIAFLRHPEWCPPGGFFTAFFFIILCTAMLWRGFTVGVRTPVKTQSSSSEKLWDDATILRSSAVFTFLGLIFYFLLNHIDIQIDPATGNWTGTATILYFFAQWLKVGMVMSFYLFIKQRSRKALLLFICAMLFVVPAIFFGGRRADTMQLVAVLLFIPFFVKQKVIPKYIFLIMAGCMLLVMCSIGTFRRVMEENEEEETQLSYKELISQVDWWEEFKKEMEDGGGQEVLNCIYAISAHQETLQFDYGTNVWNWFVWSFVPAQIVGKNVKNALYLKLVWPIHSVMHQVYSSYRGLSGSMYLGYTEVFQEFWWFGCIIYHLIGRLMGMWFRKAREGEAAYVILYTWVLNFALHTIPAMTTVLWINLFYFLVCVLPFLCVMHCQQKKSLPFPEIPQRVGTK